MPKFKFIPFAANKNGTKIFCRLICDKKNVLKGFYDYNKEQFIITKYIEENFTKDITRNKVKKALKENLIDYDWNL